MTKSILSPDPAESHHHSWKCSTTGGFGVPSWWLVAFPASRINPSDQKTDLLRSMKWTDSESLCNHHGDQCSTKTHASHPRLSRDAHTRYRLSIAPHRLYPPTSSLEIAWMVKNRRSSNQDPVSRHRGSALQTEVIQRFTATERLSVGSQALEPPTIPVYLRRLT